MRRLLTWILVSLGIAALVRRLRRRGRAEEPGSMPDDDPAAELRQKLAESRSAEAPAAEPAEPPLSPEGVDERRANVHAEGRAAVDEMRGSDTP
jgi:hypothetical protein